MPQPKKISSLDILSLGKIKSHIIQTHTACVHMCDYVSKYSKNGYIQHSLMFSIQNTHMGNVLTLNNKMKMEKNFNTNNSNQNNWVNQSKEFDYL